MSLVINYRKVFFQNFSEELYWYGEEFMIYFGKKVENYTQKKFFIAHQILTNMAQLLDVYSDETYLKEFSSFLQNVEKKYPEFFK